MKISTVAIDLGPQRSGVAALGRGHMTVRGYRYREVSIATYTLSNDEVCDVLTKLRPRIVLVERAAEGYQEGSKAYTSED